jgi:hypothetical protein
MCEANFVVQLQCTICGVHCGRYYIKYHILNTWIRLEIGCTWDPPQNAALAIPWSSWGQNESTLHLLVALPSLSHLVCLQTASASQSLICMDQIKRLVWVWLPPASKTPMSPSFAINLCLMIVVVCPRFRCMQTHWTIRVFINCEHEAYHHLLSPIAVHSSHS